ncbi:MAG: DUF547 domain-containing protein [Flavobacteriaceae bacterium]|nr:DUF547 domain-containing protein [Flavobacteriaceae bacterium]
MKYFETAYWDCIHQKSKNTIQMKKLYFVLITILLQIGVYAQQEEAFFEQSDQFFQTYVKQGRVDYQKLVDNPKPLQEVLQTASNIRLAPSNAKTYQAYWINAYNLAVIKGIVDNFPIKSPLDKAGFFDKDTYALGGKDITLNDIENKLLRPIFKDPRIHFVLVCGAIGCPPLISTAYRPETLNSQLEKQTELAINGDYFIQINSKKKRLVVSEIMKWYKEDFTQDNQSEVDFINSYKTEKLEGKYKISYFPYNWNINILK